MTSTSIISPEAKIGRGVKIWNFCNIIAGAKIGDGTSIGSYTEVGQNVVIGKNCKIEAFVLMPEGVTLGDDVFIGPCVCFTNDLYPPSPDKSGWKTIVVKDRAAIGANATILPGVVIGEDALVGAGSVVTKDVPPGMTAFGNPARVKGKRKKGRS